MNRKHLLTLLTLALPLTALAASFDVTVQNDDGSGGTAGTLSWAIQQANEAGAGPHTITLRSDVFLTGRMRRLIEQSVIIAGDNADRRVGCKAGSRGQPFWIGGALAGQSYNGVAYPAVADLAVTLSGFTITGCIAKGGDGEPPLSAMTFANGGGGGGAGLGGAVFVHHGAVTLERLRLVGNGASGGATGIGAGGSGGGMGADAASQYGGGLWSGTCGGLGAYALCDSSVGDFGRGKARGESGASGFGAGGGRLGGFGGGGGGGGIGGGTSSSGAPGGFGGGGAGGYNGYSGGQGGFGGLGGSPGAMSNTIGIGYGGAGGGGAGLGGAVFVRAGTLTLKDVVFNLNQAQRGPGAKGYGGALFVCTADLDSASGYGNTAAENCSASIDTAQSCGVRFDSNGATDGQDDYYWSGNMTALDALPSCPPSGPVSQIVIDPASAATLYAGLDGAGVYVSTDGGANWTAANAQPANLRVKALAKKSYTPLYAGTYGGGVFLATSGTTFAACATQPTNTNVLSLTLDAAGKLYAGTEGGVYVSGDQCASWSALNAGLPN